MKKKVITDELRIRFNDICMRELSLDITEDDKVFDMDTNTIIVYKDKYLKYYNGPYDKIRSNEIRFNLLENSNLLLVVFSVFLEKYSQAEGVYISSYYQSAMKGENGYAAFCKEINGGSEEIHSDLFINESVRILNLICKVNGTTNRYDFDMFDIVPSYK